MSKIKILVSLLVAAFSLPVLVFADLPWNTGAAPGLTLPTSALETTVRRIADIIFYATALIAFIMVVWGGVTLATAGGDPAKVDLARHLIMYALIAIAVGAMAWGIVNLVAGYLART